MEQLQTRMIHQRDFFGPALHFAMDSAEKSVSDAIFDFFQGDYSSTTLGKH
jgi:hypothetical protein